MLYNPLELENKWQKRWHETNAFEPQNDFTKKKNIF